MSAPDVARARALHEPWSGMVPPSCKTCRDGDEEPTVWPCPTAVALGAELDAPWTAPWGLALAVEECVCGDGWGSCLVHVNCDAGCRALESPGSLDEWKAAAQHWRAHDLIGGCSHGR